MLEPTPHRDNGLIEWCRDPAFRYGIKFGLAGVVAVFLALLIKLQEPTWALFTVFVLMIAQYVGAIGEKSVFRLLGTVIGGLIGYLLTSSLEQSPVIFLFLVGVVVATGTAMFGQSRYPYAFLLCSMTVVVVVSNGLANPENSWQYMLWRIEEVTLGIIVTVVIQSVIWPRYARVEFFMHMRSGFRDLAQCFQEVVQAESRDDTELAASGAADFPERISALRKLLDFGARESQHFRDRLSTFFELTTCQSRLASAISTMREPLPPDSFYRKRMPHELEALRRSISEALNDLASTTSSASSRKTHSEEMSRAAAAIESALLAMRAEHCLESIPDEEAMHFSVRVLAFDEIRRHIARAQALLDSLPIDPLSPSREHAPFVSPWPPPFWIRSGIKAGIAVVIALVIENWLNPPGGTMFALGTWVFTSLNATSPGGQGDRRAFYYVILSTGALLVLSLLLVAVHPLLSSYGVMNALLFTWLFVWGYLSYSTRGVSIPMQLAMLCIVGILGLNGQEAISFQQLVDFFFGIALASVLAAVVQRLLWPSLPQWEIRDRLLELIEIARRILRNGPEALPLWQRTRLALIPSEVTPRLAAIAEPVFPRGEAARLRDLIAKLAKIAFHLSVTVRRLDPLLAEEKYGEHREALRLMESQIDDVLESTACAIRTNRLADFDRSAFEASVAAFQARVTEIRKEMLHNEKPPLQILEFLGLAERYRLAAEDAVSTRSAVSAINVRLLQSDCAL